MPRGSTFGPIRPALRQWPKFNPVSFDPRQNTFIPDLGVDNPKIRSVSPRKVDLIGAKVYRSTTQTITDVTVTALSFDTEEYDEGNFHEPTNQPTRMSIPYDGVYSIVGFAEFVNGAGNDRRIFLYSNGAEVMRTKWPVTGALSTEMSLPYVGRFTAGDYLELMVRQNSGGNLNISAGVAGNFFAVTFLGTI